MRTLSSALSGHLDTKSHTRCTMLLLDLNDGTSIGVTDHDKNLVYDIGDGSVTYLAGTGILTSDIMMSTALEADSYEVTGPISSVVTLEAILGGRFNRARARLFQVNWRDLTQGAIKILAGNVSGIRPEGGSFVLEIRSDFDRFNQVVGRTLVNNCDADYADQIRCFATPTEVVGTVTAVTDAGTFTVSYTGSYADDFFNFGTVTFLTGDLAGTQPIEIFDWTVGGAITLFTYAAEEPAIGDTLTIRDGCLKSRAACMAHGQIVNFRGFPEIPGSDQILKAAIPGQGSD